MLDSKRVVSAASPPRHGPKHDQADADRQILGREVAGVNAVLVEKQKVVALSRKKERTPCHKRDRHRGNRRPQKPRATHSSQTTEGRPTTRLRQSLGSANLGIQWLQAVRESSQLQFFKVHRSKNPAAASTKALSFSVIRDLCGK